MNVIKEKTKFPDGRVSCLFTGLIVRDQTPFLVSVFTADINELM